jgi:hypothetical protein
MGGTLTGIHSARSRYTHPPRITRRPSRDASVAAVIRLKYRVPVKRRAYANSSSNALASFRSAVSKPSMNQP